MERDGLTLHEVSERLGVHYMTAYRYVRLGLLPATKRGSAWNVAEADLDGFAASERGPKPQLRKGAPWAKRLEARLLAGDVAGSWRVIDAALGGGQAVSAVYTEVMAPAMRSIGASWAAGDIGVADEHRASAVVTKLMGRLSHRMVRRGRPRGTIVIGTAAGEQHGLPVAMATDLLRGMGFDVVDLGCDIPPASFAAAVSDAADPSAVVVTATTGGSETAVSETIAHVRRARPNVPVYAGGAMVTDAAAAAALGADGWAATIDEFAAAVTNRARRG